MELYTEQTVYNEFRHTYNFNGNNQEFVLFLNTYYDKVKNTPIETIKKLLPISHHGYSGTYLEQWMIKETLPTKDYPFTMVGKIYSWYGDRTTSDILTSVANVIEELYYRMMVQYLYYLYSYKEYDEANKEFNYIINNLETM